MLNDKFYMDLAVQNAQAMKGQTDPNPLVGAIIVNDNRIVGIGAHMKAGEAHAEIHALQMAGAKAKGGTIYVTLEPCSHHGKTGPCAEAIVEAGIKRVVIGTLDPNPIVSGNGVKILENAGITVVSGVESEKAWQLNEVFNKFITHKKPFVTLKSGITLDGKIATHSYDSKWITSEESRLDAHQLRNENMAILVGVNTVIHDNPELTTRIQNGRNPIRIIIDSSLKIPEDAKVLNDKKADTWIFTSQYPDAAKEKKLLSGGIKVVRTSSLKNVDLSEMLNVLEESQISSLLIEGGGTINASFLESHLIDKVILYIAPKLIGGKEAPSFLEGKGFNKMSEAIELADMEITKIGNNFKMVGYPIYEA
ncbi:bifunctional diaminohydroxyphosphoribosylaminopyrimidine deaminase/5-amino-6-(5-phosphoribosylamino)uracil reductase RibD [Planococcus citreus]|uniref:Riboflavin biosynthesis protein RibD n=1 Tax=Planococcus citreus TaxID=1373 RepID=A0A497YJR8_9BACL|nr:bifunctional diaminohydroxyphosphoribosylaminopyrimidine deaminase/5-amino-6-(5-phosphoribosylamino)uracil reductase RibD [Planococcus citreus]RLJ91318.1 diaminohydroxyphosphoribosylaminopyrimidine deaminase/5-amino-6-(5-phosphoribosylamino)uracil reductase [Planococcus citreus]